MTVWREWQLTSSWWKESPWTSCWKDLLLLACSCSDAHECKTQLQNWGKANFSQCWLSNTCKPCVYVCVDSSSKVLGRQHTVLEEILGPWIYLDADSEQYTLPDSCQQRWQLTSAHVTERHSKPCTIIDDSVIYDQCYTQLHVTRSWGSEHSK